jgi:hypothetical protein
MSMVGDSPQRKIPIFGKLGRERDAIALRGRSPLFAANRCGTLPNPAVAAPVELNFAVQNLVRFQGLSPNNRR